MCAACFANLCWQSGPLNFQSMYLAIQPRASRWRDLCESVFLGLLESLFLCFVSFVIRCFLSLLAILIFPMKLLSDSTGMSVSLGCTSVASGPPCLSRRALMPPRLCMSHFLSLKDCSLRGASCQNTPISVTHDSTFFSLGVPRHAAPWVLFHELFFAGEAYAHFLPSLCPFQGPWLQLFL